MNLKIRRNKMERRRARAKMRLSLVARGLQTPNERYRKRYECRSDRRSFWEWICDIVLHIPVIGDRSKKKKFQNAKGIKQKVIPQKTVKWLRKTA